MNAVIAKTQGKRRILSGIATTPKPDRMGDVVEPMGARFTLPLPLLWEHHRDRPVGWVTTATPSPAGVRIVAELARGVGRADEAWELVQAGLVRFFSVGFRAMKVEPRPGGVTYREWELLEVSTVAIPANPDAAIASHAERGAGILILPRGTTERPALRIILPRKP